MPHRRQGVRLERDPSAAGRDGSDRFIPSKTSRIPALSYDRHLYKERFTVECTFNLLKGFRRFATRYEKTLGNYAAFVALACAFCRLRI